MAKYNIHISGLSPEENQKINDAANSGVEVRIQTEQVTPAKDESKTVIHQTVHQYGENNYTFDKPVSGIYIGEVIKE